MNCVAKNKTEVAPCNTQVCGGQCVDGTWREWNEWGSCSSTCDHGYRQRTREVDTYHNSCGAPATGNSEEFDQCPTMPPCIPVMDCIIAPWGDWSDCSSSCFGVRE